MPFDNYRDRAYRKLMHESAGDVIKSFTFLAVGGLILQIIVAGIEWFLNNLWIIPAFLSLCVILFVLDRVVRQINAEKDKKEEETRRQLVDQYMKEAKDKVDI